MISCWHTRRRLSAYMDGELAARPTRQVGAHLEGCPACAARWRALCAAVEMLAEAPRLESAEPVAARVLDHLEVASRGPGLALIFRPVWRARPLILPSLVPAALVLVAVLGVALALGHDPGPLPAVVVRGAESWGPTAASGTESNPVFLSSEVSAPRVRIAGLSTADVTAGLGEEPIFVETVVARDGSVTMVRLLGGDSRQARPLLQALWRERFEPGRRHGRPVAVSLYRLISRMDVFAPLT